MTTQRIHKGDGHRKRLREKFLNSGLLGFHDYEVIELLLTLGTPRKDCKNAAKSALKRFKTLQGVLEASVKELCQVDGIGPKNLFGVKLIKEVADRYLEKRLIEKVIYLDAKNKVIETETLFKGTLTASSVYPREVVAAAMNHHSAALIFAHNHPSGDPKPSKADISLTRQLLFACRMMGIIVHEHLVIGDNRYFSFADQGYIARMNREFEAK